MDTVSLSSARGVIVNFTGSSDLSLFEVQTALTDLQQQTGSQAEVVFGVITDERMKDRIQVILMITGLGAPTLEEAMGVRVQKPKVEERPLVSDGQFVSVNTSYRDRELPPFFRNRIR